MESIVADQLRSFERKYVPDDLQPWSFHDTQDPLIRFLRDRRIKLGIDRVLSITNLDPAVRCWLFAAALAAKGLIWPIADFAMSRFQTFPQTRWRFVVIAIRD